MTEKLAVLGAGSWGTALAAHLAKAGHQVTLWGRNETHINEINSSRENSRYLPDLPLPESLNVTHQVKEAVKGVNGIVIATPCNSFIPVLDLLDFHLTGGIDLTWACKGMANGQLLHEIVAQKLGEKCPISVLSGPSFATELVKGLPTAVTVASTESNVAERVSHRFHHDAFRAYQSTDIIGVQLAGALKNVYAIAAGIADGLQYGANARAALITRALAELSRLGLAMGAQRETLMGLSGIGDLVLTCTDDQSRNRRYGIAIGQGISQAEAIAGIGQVVEGANTSRQATELADQFGIDMPIARQVFEVIHENKPPNAAVSSLLARVSKPELEP